MTIKTQEIHFETPAHHSGVQKIAGLISRAVNLFPDHIPIFYKVSLLITLLIIICSVSLGGVIVYNQNRILTNQINDMGQTVVNHLARSVSEPLMAEDKFAMEVLTSSLVSGNNVVGTEILSPEGISIVTAGYSPFDQRVSNYSKTPLHITGNLTAEKNWTWRLHLPKRSASVVSFISPIFFKDIKAGYALVSFSRQALDKSRQQAIQSIGIATAMIIFFGIVMAFLLGKRLSRPVHRIMDAIDAVNNGDYSFRFDERRKDEIGQLMNAFNHMAEGMLKKSQVEQALDRYLSPSVAKQVRANLDAIKLGGQRIQASVLFADIVGYTSMSETMPAEELAQILNRYFARITKACELNIGTVDKYMGDCVMLIFGAPEADEQHCYHAAMCALLIKKVVAYENILRIKEGKPAIHFRMGINSGNMLAGNMGSRQKIEYTVVGDSVNLASRLCAAADADEIVVSRDFYQQVIIRQRVRAHEHTSLSLRGVENPVNTFILQDMDGEHKEKLEKQFKTIIGKRSINHTQ